MIKVLFCVFLIESLLAEVKAQIIDVPVGEMTYVYTPITFVPTNPRTQNCSYWEIIDSVARRVDFNDTCNWCLTGISNLGPPFYEYDREVYIIPKKAGIFSSKINLSYILCPWPSRHCINGVNGFPVCSAPQDTVKLLRINAYYDDKIKLEYDANIYFAYDTISGKYKDASSKVEIFNNKKDSVIFTDWKIIKDSSQSATLTTLVQDSLSVNQIWLSGYEHTNSIQLLFKTSLSPTVEYRSFPGTVQCHAHFVGKDSLCTIPSTFIFEAMPKSGISLSGYYSSSIEIYPNPSTGSAHAFCITKKTSSIHLHIFDELGKDIMTVYDGTLPEGKHNFFFKLSQGMYYVRMETAERVVTKKVVVD